MFEKKCHQFHLTHTFYLLTLLHSERPKSQPLIINPIALRKAKIVYNLGLIECNRVKGEWDHFQGR